MPAVFVITLAALGAVAAVLFISRPIEIGRGILRWLLLLRGARERYLQASSGRIHFYETGSPLPECEPVVFLTGLGGTGADWHSVLAALPRTGRSAFSLELAGQGKTRVNSPAGLYSMKLQLRLLSDFLETMNLKNVTLVGISLGGWIASLFAISRPERLNRLVLVASAGLQGPLGPRDVQPRNRAEARTFLNRILARHLWIPGFVLDNLIRRLNSESNRGIINAVTEPDFLDNQLHRIQLPVDLIWGENDELIGVDQAHRFQRHLPHARLHLIPHCGHIPMLERPCLFRRMLLDILEGRL